jgi:hypothetical protein
MSPANASDMQNAALARDLNCARGFENSAMACSFLFGRGKRSAVVPFL